MHVLAGWWRTSTAFLLCIPFLFPATSYSQEHGGQEEAENGTFSDPRDSASYAWIRIGSQIWMAENLKFRPEAGSWCYDDDDAMCEQLGRMYDWHAAQTACPTGWRLPSRQDFVVLADHLGPNAGEKMKLGGGSGFEAKMGGYRFYDGSYHKKGLSTNWWTTDEWRNNHAHLKSLMAESAELEPDAFGMEGAVSVRCLRDGDPGGQTPDPLSLHPAPFQRPS